MLMKIGVKFHFSQQDFKCDHIIPLRAHYCEHYQVISSSECHTESQTVCPSKHILSVNTLSLFTDGLMTLMAPLSLMWREGALEGFFINNTCKVKTG